MGVCAVGDIFQFSRKYFHYPSFFYQITQLLSNPIRDVF